MTTTNPIPVHVEVTGRRWVGSAPALLLGWAKDGRGRVRFPNGNTMHVNPTRITTIEETGMSTRYVTDKDLDRWAGQAQDPNPTDYPSTIAAMAIELRERRAAEHLTTYRLASGEDFGDAGWWNTPDLFDDADWEERTEVIHETWGLLARESIWYGTDSDEDDEEGDEA